MSIAWTTYESGLGTLTLVDGERGFTGLWFPPSRSLDPGLRDDDRLAPMAAQLDEYFAGTRTEFDLPLDLSAGSEFQQAVWEQVRTIGFGQTISYGEIARRLGRMDRVRAVAQAVGSVPIPVIVPCHRVIGSDGSLVGYGGGLPRKTSLLDHETSVRCGEGPLPTYFESPQAALF